MSKRRIVIGRSLAATASAFFAARKMRRQNRREAARDAAIKAAPEWVRNKFRAIEWIVRRGTSWKRVPHGVKTEFLRQVRYGRAGHEILALKNPDESLNNGMSTKLHGYSCYLTVQVLPYVIAPKEEKEEKGEKFSS